MFPGLQACVTLIAILLCVATRYGNCSPSKDRAQKHFELKEREWHIQLHSKLNSYAERLKENAKRSLPASSYSTPTTTNPADKEAVTALYNATIGKNWVNNSNWMKGDPCNDNWYGLYCVNGRVLQIDLADNNMAGTLPAKLAHADMLQVLRLYSNRISGAIPPELLQMKSIQILEMDNNALTDNLPDQVVAPNLTMLVLYQNHIKGNLPTQWDAPQLQVLALSSNHFTGPLPPLLSKLKMLQQLVVSRNNLTGQFPTAYGNLRNLQQLWLFYNTFDHPTIPDSWEGMTSLQNVEMDSLTGELPAYIGTSWSQLTNFVIVSGSLKGQFYTSFCSLQKVTDFRLFANQLTGTLPSCICDMKSLTDFELSDNQFTGSIPYCIGDLSSLANIYLSRNNLSGILPTSIGDLASLQVLDFSSNLLTGPVPATFAGLKEIVGFFLCYNKLNKLEDGLDPLYNRIKDYSCELYSNPWSCPLPTNVPASCQAQCSQCNSGSKHNSCSSCVADSSCGWCNEGPNCLEGSSIGPYNAYRCYPQDWTYGSSTSCP